MKEVNPTLGVFIIQLYPSFRFKKLDLRKAMCTNGFKSYPQIYSHATRQLYFLKMLIKKYLNNIQIE